MQARFLVLSMLFVLAHAVGAQVAERADSLPPIAPGARIRLQAPGIVAGSYVGVVRDRSNNLLTVNGPSTTVMVPVTRITALEVSRGKSSLDGALRGLAWGVPIGVLGGIIGMNQWGRCDGRCGDHEFGYVNRGFGAVAGSTATLALIGAGIGALVGRERWAPLRERDDAR